MDFNNDLFLIGVSLGFIFLITGFILLKFPPNNINFLYGYRTKNSMKSKERWDFAQQYSAKLMIKGGIYFLVLGVIGPFLNLSDTLNVAIGIGSLLLFCIFLIINTEKKLKQKFESDETI
jgi:uncharacterized membrane protein